MSILYQRKEPATRQLLVGVHGFGGFGMEL